MDAANSDFMNNFQLLESESISGFVVEPWSLPSKPFSIDAELFKIPQWTCRESMTLWSGFFTCEIVSTYFNEPLFQAAFVRIGHEELRKSLGFAPPGPWSSYRPLDPNKDILKSAKSVEDYYNLREPHVKSLSDMAKWFAEPVHSLAVEYMDKRSPGTRNIFKKRFQEIRKKDQVSRTVVDKMIFEFERIFKKWERAMSFKKVRSDQMQLQHRWEPCDSYASLNNFTLISSDSFRSFRKRAPQPFEGPINIDAELSYMPCLTNDDLKSLWNNTLTPYFAQFYTDSLLQVAARAIGFQELRIALGIPPRNPKLLRPMELVGIDLGDFEFASMEDYLDMNLKIHRVFAPAFALTTEASFDPLIAFLDARLPEIRSVFQTKFEEMSPIGDLMNKEKTDRIIEEFVEISEKRRMKEFDCGKLAKPVGTF